MKLRVTHIPQVGSDVGAFYVPVQSPEEAVKVMGILAAYDEFQFEHNVKPDFTNFSYLEMFDEEEHEWVGWEYVDDENYFDSAEEYVEELSDQKAEVNKFWKAIFSQVHF